MKAPMLNIPSSRLFNKINCCSVSLIWTLAQTFYLYFNTLFCLNVSIIPNISLNFCVWLNARCWEQLYFWFQMLLYYRVLVWFHYLILVTKVAIHLFHFCSKLKKLSEDSLTKQPEEVFDVLEKLGEGWDVFATSFSTCVPLNEDTEPCTF